VAHTENHAGSEDAAVIRAVDTGGTDAAGGKRFEGDGRAIGECPGDLVAEGGLETHREEVEIGTTDSGRGDLDEDSFAGRCGYLDDLRYSFGTTDCTHEYSPCEIQKTGR
jgi:hypothetical protein